MAVIINIGTLNLETPTNCQVCPVSCAYLSISTRSAYYDSKVWVSFSFVSILFFPVLRPSTGTSNPILFQFFAFSAFSLSSLLIILRMYAFYALAILPFSKGGAHWFAHQNSHLEQE